VPSVLSLCGNAELESLGILIERLNADLLRVTSQYAERLGKCPEPLVIVAELVCNAPLQHLWVSPVAEWSSLTLRPPRRQGCPRERRGKSLEQSWQF
jgi:hypothetical protein